MFQLPIEDLSKYQNIFEIEFSKEILKQNIIEDSRKSIDQLEKIQKCKFDELEKVFLKKPIDVAKTLLEWLKFNFTHLQKECDELNKYYNKDKNEITNDYIIYYSDDYDSVTEFIEDFKNSKAEYERHKKIGYIKKSIIHKLKSLIEGINIKDKIHIAKSLESLSFPEEYNKFKVILPKMIKYQKEFRKKVFYRGNISKQFLKFLNKTNRSE
jgi:hypothetical protein